MESMFTFNTCLIDEIFLLQKSLTIKRPPQSVLCILLQASSNLGAGGVRRAGTSQLGARGRRGNCSSSCYFHMIRVLRLKSFTSSIVVKNMDLHVTLNDGLKMPLFGLGVFNALGDSCRDAVKFALQNGYRLIDTAALYK